MQRPAAETRDHVLRVAGGLFYWKSIRATGVDLVATEAGVAPTTLYRLFASKDGLVGAYVEHAAGEFRETFAEAVAAAGPDPREQILAVFDTVYGQVASEQFRGCALQMTLAEFPDRDLPAHRNAVAAKAWFRESIGELTARLGVRDPAALADHLTLVFEGLNASGQSLGPEGPAKRARGLVEVLLTAALA
ncbi:TetR/AcrR family transcriptional regulator [Nonomuraea sp. SBT364]|uniref:TetR/AcrR family transcriptional regulator n=1 Tax=Nonomuraea sp. SBT364 TaxID=1580530 RepID=UPI00066EAF51|nr:TetR/AcrR family transcriptional regulator [Nonomuraea sp. SBT364]